MSNILEPDTFLFILTKGYEKIKKYVSFKGRNDAIIKINNKILINATIFIHDSHTSIYLLADNVVELNNFLVLKGIDFDIDHTTASEYILEKNEFDIFDCIINNNPDKYIDLLLESYRLSNAQAIQYLTDNFSTNEISYENKLQSMKEIFVEYEHYGIGIIKLLLEKMEDNDDFEKLINSFDMCMYLAMCTDLETLQLFVSYGTKFKKYMNTMYFIAIKHNSIDIAEYLRAKGATCFFTVDNIIKCAENNYIDAMDFICGKCETDLKWIDYVFMDSEEYSIEIVEILVNNGANVKKYGEKLYKKAKKCKNNHLAEYLRECIG
jgi:hypothetical protein